MSETLRIGELAEAADVGVETVRYYERRGLMPEPPRSPTSGYRRYPPDAVDRLRFIRSAKKLGFTLSEIDDLLSLRASGAGCGRVRSKAVAKIEDIEDRIGMLQRMRDALRDLVEVCEERGTSGACPILDSLESHSGAR